MKQYPERCEQEVPKDLADAESDVRGDKIGGLFACCPAEGTQSFTASTHSPACNAATSLRKDLRGDSRFCCGDRT